MKDENKNEFNEKYFSFDRRETKNKFKIQYNK